MLLISHAAVGAAIASVIPEPLVYVPLSFASHFVVDLIPHSHVSTRSRYVIHQAILDLALTLCFLYFLFVTFHDTNLLWGAFAGMIMDVDAVFYNPKMGRLKKHTTRIFPDFISKIHGGCQRETKKFIGIANTVLVFVLGVTVILLAKGWVNMP